jgi:hypothetical protein
MRRADGWQRAFEKPSETEKISSVTGGEISWTTVQSISHRCRA